MFRLILGVFFVLMLIDTASAASFFPKAFSGKFVQEKKSLNGKRVKKSNFNIKYQYPSNVYLKSSGQSDVTYVCNRKKVWMYQPPLITGERGTLQIGKTSQHCYSSLFDSLKNGLKNNKTYSVKKLKGKTYELNFKSRAQARLGVTKLQIILKGSKKTFTGTDHLKIFYSGEKYPTVLRVNSIKTVKRFGKNTFVFRAPKNTNVSNL